MKASRFGSAFNKGDPTQDGENKGLRHRDGFGVEEIKQLGSLVANDVWEEFCIEDFVEELHGELPVPAFNRTPGRGL